MANYMIKKMSAAFPELAQSRTLLAVSGGIDSMTMLHLFEAAGWAFGVAHCNFQLRGADSDEDAVFVKTSALQLGKTCHVTDFETEAEAKARGISIQMAARELRYEWLEAVRQEHRYDFIATAHHLSDSIETSLINQTRGTGLRGLSGISARQGALIRPLLMFTRQELKAYLEEHEIAYREDSSNAKTEYQRNRIRHQVIPVLQSINPSFEQTFEKNLNIWSEASYLVEWACDHLAAQYIEKDGHYWRIALQFIQDHPDAATTLLFEWLKSFGFHTDQLHQALQSAGNPSGAIWSSATHRLLLDREAFVVAPLPKEEGRTRVYRLESPAAKVDLPGGRLSGRLVDRPEHLTFDTSENIAQLDAAKLQFPLSIRHWRKGDVFCPLGMDGKQKKLQDFFSDEKLNRFAKEQIWLLINGNGDIVWILGYRMDDRYKIDARTRKIFRLEFRMQ